MNACQDTAHPSNNKTTRMEKLATLLCTLSLSLFANAQCSVSVPANSTIVDQDATIDDGNGGNYWVCPGVNATFTGLGVFVFAAEGCTIDLNGTLGVVIAKPNGSVTVAGLNNSVYHDASTSVVDNGSNTYTTLCDAVVFTSTPTTGCAIGAGVGQHAAPLTATVFPNPAHDRVTVQVQGARLLAARILDASGRLVRAYSATDGVLDLAGVVPGNYVVEARTATGIWHTPVIVQ